jgi:hypothetical protein
MRRCNSLTRSSSGTKKKLLLLERSPCRGKLWRWRQRIGEDDEGEAEDGRRQKEVHPFSLGGFF